jgi:hypothetical protein
MNISRVLMLAYYFPPLAGVASERAVALARGLLNFGWEPTVVTAERGFYHRTSDEPDAGVPVVRTRSLELSRLVRGAYTSATNVESQDSATTVRPVQAGRAGRHLRRLVRDWLYIPDAQIGWLPFAVSEGNRQLRNGGGASVLLSTSVPFTSHLAAMRLAQRWRLPWVAEFRDPWSTAWWPDQTESTSRRRLNAALERRIVASADHVVVTSESTLDEMVRAHSGLDPDRISVVTNGFVPSPVREQPKSGQPMELAYAGGVTAGEDLEPILQALDRVHTRFPGAFRLRVLGPSDPWIRSPTGAAGPSWLVLEGVASPAAAREAVLGSSAVLLVQRHPAYWSTLPGKAFEYIGSRRPIVAVIAPERELAAMLRAHSDARIVAPQRVDSVEDEIERLLSEHREGTLQGPRVSSEQIEPLQRSEQARRLAEILDTVTRRRRSRPTH